MKYPKPNESGARKRYKRFDTLFTFMQFLEHVDIGSEDECWLWRGSTEGQNSYGQFRWVRKRINMAHVASYIFFKGNIPKKHGKKTLYVLHTCDTPLCVNPKHLWLGTSKDNNHDMIKKGRNKQASGRDHWNYKITHHMRKKIRKFYKTGNYSLQTLGDKFDISFQHVSRIINKRRKK